MSFPAINRTARSFAQLLRRNRTAIVHLLTSYETHEVANDEIERTLDLVESLEENETYFSGRIRRVATFLPKNQPLYALSCFGIIPALMADEVIVRPPSAAEHLFGALADLLELRELFPKLLLSFEQRQAFVDRISALEKDETTGQSRPFTSAVIFTGTMENADRLRKRFHEHTLFIANGAGHNPVVVAEDADLSNAVRSACRLQLYNQGQDCAGPNSILVASSVVARFLELLREALRTVKVGQYADEDVRVGPLSELSDLKRVQEIFLENARWIDPETPGLIQTKDGIVYPTIIVKPLREGGNFKEQFAPVFFVQEYDDDSELNAYFEDPRYAHNAMYVTLFGTSAYIERLRHCAPGAKKLHGEDTILRNTDLHAPGVERGVKPYGGYGRGASCFSIDGTVYPCPTLPQREIYERLIVTGADRRTFAAQVRTTARRSAESPPQAKRPSPQGASASLIAEKNCTFARQLSGETRQHVLKLRDLIAENAEDVHERVFDIPKYATRSPEENSAAQREFFLSVYNLLLGQDTGPRIATLLQTSPRGRLTDLLSVDACCNVQ